MTPTRQGSIRLFRLWGIDVHLHWSWFLVAVYSISTRVPNYRSPIWGACEYAALFLIVLMHEFGHALACRQVGGKSDQIVLWPLGGVAYVAPPPRAGATLWSIAAGPLVNVVLLPVLFGVLFIDYQIRWNETFPDLHSFIRAVSFINLSLLCFNLLPIYPLDGGQILRSLLWYPLGRARSLMIATVIGFMGGAALVAVAVLGMTKEASGRSTIWIGLIAVFLLSYCWRSFQEARILRKIEQLPRRLEYVCPTCYAAPPRGNFWRCRKCSQGFDLFANAATCPHCGEAHDVVPCIDCGTAHLLSAWEKRDRAGV